MHTSFTAFKLIRYAVAYVFIISGLMKFLNADIAGHFLHLGLPYPHIMLNVIIILEIGCGLLILLNKSVKNAAIPLMAIMAGALLLTKLPNLEAGFLPFAFQARLDIVTFILLIILYRLYP
ncbi:DoxX family protein [Neobacillus muris]|uniref:DoxX family protein n=1 Tax=Neobacillus muris TaxID=2941334 RepID=UPI00203F8DB1|nr:DoxX family protein [Neobacillus muris]